MTAPLSAESAFTRVHERAESIRNDAAHTIKTCSPGDGWAQGDIALVCLTQLPADSVAEEKPAKQLAPGNTQGSRHEILNMSAVTLFRLKASTPLDGPIIKARRAFTVTHPEHGDITLPAGVWAVIYQCARADDLRRTQD